MIRKNFCRVSLTTSMAKATKGKRRSASCVSEDVQKYDKRDQISSAKGLESESDDSDEDFEDELNEAEAINQLAKQSNINDEEDDVPSFA